MGTAAEQTVALLLWEKGNGASIRHSRRFNFLNEGGGTFLYPFQELEIVVVVPRHPFITWAVNGQTPQMKVGKTNLNRIQPVRNAVNSPNRSDVWQELILGN